MDKRGLEKLVGQASPGNKMGNFHPKIQLVILDLTFNGGAGIWLKATKYVTCGRIRTARDNKKWEAAARLFLKWPGNARYARRKARATLVREAAKALAAPKPK